METLYDFLQDEAGKNFEVENVAERLKCIGEQSLDTFKREKQEIDFELFLEGFNCSFSFIKIIFR